MRLCRHCGNKIPATIRIEGKRRNLGNRVFCLACSPFKHHNTKTYVTSKGPHISTCKYCGRSYLYSRATGHRKDRCNSCIITRRKLLLKQRAVAHKGGKCEICGYQKCLRALQFHHLDRSTKEFGIGGAETHHYAWARLRKELTKCVLLCANCHAEVEAGVTSI